MLGCGRTKSQEEKRQYFAAPVYYISQASSKKRATNPSRKPSDRLARRISVSSTCSATANASGLAISEILSWWFFALKGVFIRLAKCSAHLGFALTFTYIIYISHQGSYIRGWIKCKNIHFHVKSAHVLAKNCELGRRNAIFLKILSRI